MRFTIFVIFLLIVGCQNPEISISIPSCTLPNDSCVSDAVKGFVYPLKQKHQFACWATVLTMMESWKEQQLLTPQMVLQRYGDKFKKLYDRSDTAGILIQDEIELYKKAGIEIERQLDPSIEGWSEFIRDFGPLSITIDANPPYGGTVHALLIVGIYGAIDGQKTTIIYIDPSDGKIHSSPFMNFLKMYEAKFAVDWPVQIIHFPSMTKDSLTVN